MNDMLASYNLKKAKREIEGLLEFKEKYKDAELIIIKKDVKKRYV
jgi:hypothetical protein